MDCRDCVLGRLFCFENILNESPKKLPSRKKNNEESGKTLKYLQSLSENLQERVRLFRKLLLDFINYFENECKKC